MKKLMCLLIVLFLICGCSSKQNNESIKDENLNITLFNESDFFFSLKQFIIKDNKLIICCNYSNDYDSDIYAKLIDITINDYTFVSKEKDFVRIDYDDGGNLNGDVSFIAGTKGVTKTNEIDLKEYGINEIGSISFALELSKNEDYSNSVVTDAFRYEFINNYNALESLANMKEYDLEIGKVYIESVSYTDGDSFSKPTITIKGFLINETNPDYRVYVSLFANGEQIKDPEGKESPNTKQGSFSFKWETNLSKKELEDSEIKLAFEMTLGKHCDVIVDSIG